MWRVDSDDGTPTAWYETHHEAIAEKLRRTEQRRLLRPQSARHLPVHGIEAWYDAFDYETHNQGRVA